MTRHAAGGSTPDRGTDSLSPRAQDYLKAVWSATEFGADPITTTALAGRFGTSPASATDTVQRLAEQGLLRYAPYRPVRLTAEGERHAVAMVRRHRLLETYLCTHLGYAWDEVHDEAERLEHAATDRLIERIDAVLGHPAADPHGDPIPDPQGRIRPHGDVGALAAAAPGPVRVFRVSDADPALLRAARSRGLVPGARTTAPRADVSAELAEAVWVRPE